MSSSPFTPPLAITGRSTRRARSSVASIFTPLSRPSRPMSVKHYATDTFLVVVVVDDDDDDDIWIPSCDQIQRE